ncbi:ubiquinone biosynthesis protein COQ7-domain-containing protein [Lasiosphaeria ovina]|uniref:5-demethoxyubiquinone hydroxylase, mitochondrial n=1 Tax=Lasiosphaeria ovina TaxID=92902 RepID=A0AAE0NM38_9PEZI|nr:ubiquinone biosynthesis protein COQ7-domain-containing protein [Lasiosphaeria ovina]
MPTSPHHQQQLGVFCSGLLATRPSTSCSRTTRTSCSPNTRRPLSTTPVAAVSPATPTNNRQISNQTGNASGSGSSTHNEGRTQSKKRIPLTAAQREFLSSALRVNQAGELAATLIYTAQTPPVVSREPHLRPLMRHMYEQEAAHLSAFNALIAKHRVRPTALYPVWSLLASGLGWTTGVMGREAAMACTEAVETEIGDHYNAQIRRLLEMVTEWETQGYEVGGEFKDLIVTLRRIRDEELEHLDHAVEHDAKKAEPYWLLTGVIRAGCRGAIWVSERV